MCVCVCVCVQFVCVQCVCVQRVCVQCVCVCMCVCDAYLLSTTLVISRNRRTSDLHTFRFGIFVLEESYPVSICEIELNFKFIVFCKQINYKTSFACTRICFV